MIQCTLIVTFMWEVNLCNKTMGYWNTLVVEAKVFVYIRECHLKNSQIENYRNLTFPLTPLRCTIFSSSIPKSSKVLKMRTTWIM